jgi:hypothetical protein
MRGHHHATWERIRGECVYPYLPVQPLGDPVHSIHAASGGYQVRTMPHNEHTHWYHT